MDEPRPDPTEYITSLFAVQDQPLQKALEETEARGLPPISVCPDEGRFLQLLARLAGARRAVEIGTLGGYSGIWIARGMLPGGKLYTIEKNELHAKVAQEHFNAASVADQVEISVGEARQVLERLAAEAPFDLVFIDAEKAGYLDYYEWAVEHLRVGGVVAAHNALWSGRVFDPQVDDSDTQTIREFNQRAASDPRVISTIFPAGDGTLVAVKMA